MKIALAQIFCPWGDRSGNLKKIEWFSRQARAAGAELVVFPELTVSGIFKDVRVKQIAEPLNGYSVKWVSALARSIGITIGFGFTEKAEPLPFNTYCLIDSRGKPAAVYRKIYIPRLEVPFWQGSRQRPVFRVGGKRLTIAICWDATQEELLAHYGRQKAEIVLMPHAWDSDPLDKNGKPLEYDSMAELIHLADAGNLGGWKSFTEMRDYFYSYIPGYAKKYRFAACFVNQTGQPHKYLRFVGPTFAVDRQGRILAETRNEEEGLLYVEIQ